MSAAAVTGAGRWTVGFLAAVLAMDALAFSLVLPLLPIYLADSRTPVPLVVAIFAVFSIAQFLTAPHWGRLADRFGRRPVILVSQFGTAVGFVILAVATTPWLILLARVIDGATAGNATVINAVVCDRYPDEQRARAFGVLNTAGAVGAITGLALAAALANHSLALLGWCAAAAAAVTVLIGLVVPLPPARADYTVLPVRRIWAELPLLRRPGGVVFVSQLGFAALMTGLAVLLADHAGMDRRTTLLVMLAAMLIGGGVATPTVGALARWHSVRAAAGCGFAIQLLGLLGLAAAVGVRASPPELPGVLLIGVLTTVLAAGTVMVLSCATTLMSTADRDHRLGTGQLMGISQSITSVGQLLGPALAISALALGAPAFLGMLAVIALAGMFWLRGDRHVR